MNIAVAQSGGPTCAINASLAGVFAEAHKSGRIEKVYGALNGINGVINGSMTDLTEQLSDERELELLRLTPSTALGSCRTRLPDYRDDDSTYRTILSRLDSLDIGMFFYIGGNDSMDTAAKLSSYCEHVGHPLRVIGIPKTIDNDLPHTDHSPGFGSAAKYIATTVQEIIRDSRVYALKSVTIIEIMGRDAGWLTASACMLRANGETAPHLIYLPEAPFDPTAFIEEVKRLQQTSRAVIVAASEGLRTADGRYAAETVQSGDVDVFGHRYLAGLGKYLEQLVREHIGCKVRSVELNVSQRCASHCASLTDLSEAEAAGRYAVKLGLSGETGRMVAIRRSRDSSYKAEYTSVDVGSVANNEQRFPREWILPTGSGVTDGAVKYFLPLIAGEVSPIYKNGIPMHFRLREQAN